MISNLTNCAMNEEKKTIHMDYIDGLPWIESVEDLPICNQEYSTFPTSVFTSMPCKAMTVDGRFIQAVYVYGVSNAISNDGSRCIWHGWAEKTGDADDYTCVDKVLLDESINVLRWHYNKGVQMPTQNSFAKMLAIENYKKIASKYIDSHPREWPLVQEDGTWGFLCG